MQYLDALEGLRTQGFPDESITTKRYEVLQRFTDGVPDLKLRQELAVFYGAENFLTDPPTVESPRFTTRQLERYRSLSAKPYDPRYAMGSRHGTPVTQNATERVATSPDGATFETDVDST